MQPLSRRLAPGRQVAPPDWRVAFGRRAPIEVDLGCGRGHYALDRARHRPEIDLVALDTRAKWICRLRDQARAEGLRNLRAIRCDARHDLRLLFGPGTVRAFTIHHPDPWWKKRHRKRRLVTSALAAELATLLRPGGWIFVQTDVPDLAAELEAVLGACLQLAPLDAERLKREELAPSRSHREARCLKLGIPVRSLAFERRPDEARGPEK
ncbi:MAG: methyltransferase domain-containing protein [Deltaproteobacteria bacterium]|nr:methyltransferase domain-containing protein [Deltaproteobacteria bacterium]